MENNTKQNLIRNYLIAVVSIMLIPQEIYLTMNGLMTLHLSPIGSDTG